MPNTTRGVGLFTAENIVAAIRAIPESDGTYRDVARKAKQYGGTVHYHTISNWVSHGRADLEAGQPSTAYARFTKRYRELVDQHCGRDTNRNREFDRALEILERTCECGNDKMLLPDVSTVRVSPARAVPVMVGTPVAGVVGGISGDTPCVPSLVRVSVWPLSSVKNTHTCMILPSAPAAIVYLEPVAPLMSPPPAIRW